MDDFLLIWGHSVTRFYFASPSYETHACKILCTCDKTPKRGGALKRLLVELLWYFSADMLESFLFRFSAELEYVQMRPQTGKCSEKRKQTEQKKEVLVGPCSARTLITSRRRDVLLRAQHSFHRMATESRSTRGRADGAKSPQNTPTSGPRPLCIDYWQWEPIASV